MTDEQINNKKYMNNQKNINIKNSRIKKNKKQRFDVAKKEHIENTVNITKILIKILVVILVILGFIYVCCRYIGNLGIVVKEYSIDYERLPDSFYGLKIIQISDVNFNKKTMPMSKIEKLVEKVNSLNPDIIVFTGNLIYDNTSQEELKKLEDYFSSLEASIGKYAVFGSDKDSTKIVLKNAGFIDIENTYDLIYHNNYEPILINGISDVNPDITSAFAYFDEEDINTDIFTISLVHKPDQAIEFLSGKSVDMILSGHSLGGQIKIPGIGGLIKADGAIEYVNDYYQINGTDLYVSSGVGTRNYPYRLFNHPSINLFRLK